MGGKRKTTEEKLLAMANGSVRLVKKLIDGTAKANPSTRLAAARLILSLKLAKDKKDGTSSSSYESQLLGKGGK